MTVVEEVLLVRLSLVLSMLAWEEGPKTVVEAVVGMAVVEGMVVMTVRVVAVVVVLAPW